MTKRADDELCEITKHLTHNGGRGRHSPLFRWLFKRALAFGQILAELEPSWESAAEAFKRLDVRDGAGNHPSGECVRLTWVKVRRAKGWIGKPSGEPRTTPMAAAPVVTVSLPSLATTDTPTPPPSTSRDAAKARLFAQFKNVTIRKEP